MGLTRVRVSPGHVTKKGRVLRALAEEWMECWPMASRLVREMDCDKVEGSQ